MNPSNHTPGPWRQTGLNVRSGDALICWVTDHYFNIETSNSEKFANARLIASAPELLRALEWLVDDWERVTGRTLPDDHEAKAAISKAKGQP